MNGWFRLCWMVLVGVICSTAAHAQLFEQVVKAVASDRSVGDQFGLSVAIFDTTAVIGADYEDDDANGMNLELNAGSAYVFVRENGAWVERQKLVASDRAPDDRFGSAVSIDGNWIALGAKEEDHDTAGASFLDDAGAAYIYYSDSLGQWSEQQKLVAADRGAGDEFGNSISISGNYAIVGAYQEDHDLLGGATAVDAGAAYVFERDSTGAWVQVAKLVASDREAGDEFGGSVAISGNYAVVGSSWESEDVLGANTLMNAGSAYIFERDSTGTWTEVQKIVASDRDVLDRFGVAVAIHNSTLVVGAMWESEDAMGMNTLVNSGSAYVFDRDSTGTWQQVQKLVSSQRALADFFGSDVALTDNYIVSGVPFADTDTAGGSPLVQAGGANIFVRDQNGLWTELQRVVPNDRGAGDKFGFAIGASEHFVISGAFLEDEDADGNNTLSVAGSAYIFCPVTKDTISPVVCDQFAAPSGSRVYTVTGTYTDTLTNRFQCDSLLTIELTVLNTYDTISVATCASYTVPSGDETYVVSGTYGDTLLNAAGCDSILTIHLAILNTTDSFAVAQCGAYTVPSGATYTTSGIYHDTIPNAAGCDSLLTIDLTILPGSSQMLTLSACDSFQLPSGQATVFSSGTYHDTLTNQFGCDSVLTIHLTINTSATATIVVSACQQYTVPSGDETYTLGGIYSDTIPSATGCDSVLTVLLSILNSSNSLTVTVCDHYTVPSGDETYTASGTYVDTIPNAAGCDSLLTIQLTVLQSSSQTITVTACDSYTVPSGDETYALSGTYLDTLPNAVGCDSLLTIQLTILQSSSQTLNITACDSYTVPSGDETYTLSGTYLDTIPNQAGCDSVLTIVLAVFPSQATAITITACAAFTVPSGNATYTASGTYQDTLATANGCDSILTIQLTIQNTADTLHIAACDSYTVPSGDETYTSSGVFHDTIANANGCDSLLTIVATIGQTSVKELNVVACDAYVVPSGQATYTTSGAYHDTLVNASGCDSLLNINLTILNSSADTLQVMACDAYTVPSGQFTYSVSGTVQDTLVNHLGCDSVLFIDLTIRHSTTDTISVDACGAYTSPSGQFTWDQTGFYTDTLANQAGCDSLLWIDLTVAQADTSVQRVGASLIATATADSIQWLSCEDNFAAVPSATNPVFTPQSNGQYAVMVADEGCVDTSACYQVTNVGTREPAPVATIRVHPNPTSGLVWVKADRTYATMHVQVASELGEVLEVFRARSTDQLRLNLDLAAGFYWIIVRLDEGPPTVHKVLLL